MTLEFFATVQNMMLYAVTGRTAAEVVHDRADAEKPHMGLTTWKGAARGRRPTKADTEAAKNYLNAEEIATLNLLVTQYLDFAELQARRRRPMRMADWQTRLHDFLTLNEQDILEGAGRISAKMAKECLMQRPSAILSLRFPELRFDMTSQGASSSVSNLCVPCWWPSKGDFQRAISENVPNKVDSRMDCVGPLVERARRKNRRSS